MTEDKLERKHLMRITVQGPLYDETQKKFLWITDVALKVGDDKPKSSSYYTDASIPFDETIKQIPTLLEHFLK